MASKSGHTRAATATYISEMLKELRTMGQQIDADFLVYLIEMASIEASDVARGKETGGRVVTAVVEKAPTPSADELAELFMAGAYD